MEKYVEIVKFSTTRSREFGESISFFHLEGAQRFEEYNNLSL